MKPEMIIEIIKKNKVVLVVILVIAGWFCWFQLRPELIKLSCRNELSERFNNLKEPVSPNTAEIFNHLYTYCVNSKGQ